MLMFVWINFMTSQLTLDSLDTNCSSQNGHQLYEVVTLSNFLLFFFCILLVLFYTFVEEHTLSVILMHNDLTSVPRVCDETKRFRNSINKMCTCNASELETPFSSVFVHVDGYTHGVRKTGYEKSFSSLLSGPRNTFLLRSVCFLFIFLFVLNFVFAMKYENERNHSELYRTMGALASTHYEIC